MKPIPTINMREPLQAIKEKYNPGYYLKSEALSEAAALWGLNPNKHGVFPFKTEILYQRGHITKAEIDLAETSKGYWLIGLSACTRVSGFGYAPSVWDVIGYHSYEDARLAAVLKLTNWFSNVLKTPHYQMQTLLEEIKAVIEVLQSEKMPQLELF